MCIRDRYEEAAAVKTARQRNTFEKNLEGLDLLRDLVRCAECGAPMRRRVSSKHRIRESWDCTNPDCGQRIRISDTHLLEKVTILMNRIIANSYLPVSYTHLDVYKRQHQGICPTGAYGNCSSNLCFMVRRLLGFSLFNAKTALEIGCNIISRVRFPQ